MADELERTVATFVRGPTDGLIVLGGPRSNAQRDRIAAMIARHRIPAVYAARYFVTAGGLISYGPDFVDQYRGAAGYVDRILKGGKSGQPPRAGADQARIGDQLEDRQGARSRNSTDAACPRRRGDRVKGASSSRFSAARPRLGRLWRGRSKPAKLPTIGFLGTSTRSVWVRNVASFEQRLHELGWIEDRNLAIEYRWAEGREERYSEIAAEFCQTEGRRYRHVGRCGRHGIRGATSIIPIVFAVANDPLGTGLVASLARPGGNVTGLSNQASDLDAKRLELLREVVPNLHSLAIMANVGYPSCRAGDGCHQDKRPQTWPRRHADRNSAGQRIIASGITALKAIAEALLCRD